MLLRSWEVFAPNVKKASLQVIGGCGSSQHEHSLSETAMPTLDLSCHLHCVNIWSGSQVVKSRCGSVWSFGIKGT